jgi:PTS system sucrose-specific IIC component
MTKNYSALAKQIIAEVGEKNVESVTHCQTRLRFVVKDRSQISDQKLEALDGVKGVFFGSGQYQVIIGTGVVNDVYDAIAKLGTVNAIYGNDDLANDLPLTTVTKPWCNALWRCYLESLFQSFQ